MKFGFMLDSPAYKPHYLEEASIQRAISLLEQKLPVKRMSQHDSVAPVEFWEDKGVERKDMSFEDVRSVYKLYPGRDGHLKCDELAQRLWNELPAQQRDPHMEKWLGDHHSRGLVYLRYGQMGWEYGVDGLARIGSTVLSHLQTMSETMESSKSAALFNDLGFSYDEAKKAGLAVALGAHFSVRSSVESIPPELSGKTAPGVERWFLTVDDALDYVYKTWSPKGSPSHYNLYLNGEKCIFQFERDECKAVKDLDLHADLSNFVMRMDTQMALAAIQSCVSQPTLHPDKLYFYPVTTPDGPSLINAAEPDAGLDMSLVMENCAEKGIWDAQSALKAFNDLGDVPGKRLDVCVFNSDSRALLQRVAVLRQEGPEIICGEVPERYILGRNNRDICDILSQAFDKTLPLENWTVRLIMPGDRYGEKDNLFNTDNKPLVEFYDADYKGNPRFGPYGQFTGGRYYLETLQGKGVISSGRGEHRCELSLDDSIPKWTVSAKDMNVIMDWLDTREAQLLKDRKPSLSDQMQSAEKRTGKQKDAPAPEQEKDR